MGTRARKYTKRVQIWQTAAVPDGFGGNTTSEEMITESWAKIRTVSNNSRFVERLVDLGITDPTQALIITLRFRDDIDYNAVNRFLVYNSRRYYIQNAATNINEFNSEIEIIATRERTQSVPSVTPIP